VCVYVTCSIDPFFFIRLNFGAVLACLPACSCDQGGSCQCLHRLAEQGLKTYAARQQQQQQQLQCFITAGVLP
jgi:hypothetical protein